MTGIPLDEGAGEGPGPARARARPTRFMRRGSSFNHSLLTNPTLHTRDSPLQNLSRCSNVSGSNAGEVVAHSLPSRPSRSHLTILNATFFFCIHVRTCMHTGMYTYIYIYVCVFVRHWMGDPSTQAFFPSEPPPLPRGRPEVGAAGTGSSSEVEVYAPREDNIRSLPPRLSLPFSTLILHSQFVCFCSWYPHVEVSCCCC